MPSFQGWEIILILVVILLLFGAKKLPDAARGLGRSMRILKAETKGLRDDDGQDEPRERGYSDTRGPIREPRQVQQSPVEPGYGDNDRSGDVHAAEERGYDEHAPDRSRADQIRTPRHSRDTTDR